MWWLLLLLSCLRYSLLQLLRLHMLLLLLQLLLLMLDLGLLILLLLLLLRQGRPATSIDYLGKGRLRGKAVPRRHCHGSSYSGSLAVATNDKNGIT